MTHPLLDLGVAALADGGGLLLAPGFAPVWAGAAFAGPAATVTCPAGDNLALQVAVAEAPPGSVVVCAVEPGPPCGYVGDVLATAAQVRGVAGILVDGGVRDVAGLASLGFPVVAPLLCARGPSKSGPGEVGGPVEVGGVTVHPGDVVVADVDGVVVLPVDGASEVVERATAKASREPGLLERIRGGGSTLDVLGLDGSVVRRRDG